ncbi:ribose-phosphate pyrophosphokinase 1 [Exophiala xenobiotica]|uniref:Ribose-phosphate pyrophosphokinase 1 n=1 Tax=Lithohypha guttulata TaxID=1690604 RepID=A0ABR0KP37_9EURO|nr:ribose-phosphate pyrophosphokinase 1 [Lithohypha guttulata]KAK5330782.1 ribose-phosphate pyrophosphokinase 1 [Exophiala xenobiotica]
MRGVKVFAGRSHPELTEAICQRLGMNKGSCDLGNFANGETSVQINTSIRNEDVFIVQSGSKYINDSVMELLIMIAACKGGSAKSITAVMPYFPYARSSKKKSHRGAITAKMIANLMTVAGVTHVITVDLHASQMQGFFPGGVDNLHCEYMLARWIKANVKDWQDAVIVSKNVGGSKRVTSLADTLRLSFALCSTDRKRATMPNRSTGTMTDSIVFFDAIQPNGIHTNRTGRISPESEGGDSIDPIADQSRTTAGRTNGTRGADRERLDSNATQRPTRPRNVTINSSPLVQTVRRESVSRSPSPNRLSRVETMPNARRASEYEAQSGFYDEKARDVVIGRLVHGHIVDEDHPSPALSAMSGFGDRAEPLENPAMDPMTSSFVSNASSFQPGHALGGTIDAAASSEDEEDDIQNPDLEHTVTLVGNVRNRTAIITDDIMDRSGSWVAAAETCVKIGGAKKVYCIGIHPLLGENALEEMEACDCIDHIVITNTFPLDRQRLEASKKVVVIDLSNLLSESIRRNHHGESISTLFMQD